MELNAYLSTLPIHSIEIHRITNIKQSSVSHSNNELCDSHIHTHFNRLLSNDSVYVIELVKRPKIVHYRWRLCRKLLFKLSQSHSTGSCAFNFFFIAESFKQIYHETQVFFKQKILLKRNKKMLRCRDL